MTEMIYEYDGSFEGFLTCIFESYAQKEVLTAISCGEDLPFTLFPVRTVLTDRDHAARARQRRVSPPQVSLRPRPRRPPPALPSTPPRSPRPTPRGG